LKINSLDAISWHLTTRSSIYKNSRRREMIRGKFFLVGKKMGGTCAPMRLPWISACSENIKNILN
jgi:hypothetical protein